MRIEKDGTPICSLEDWLRLAPPKDGAKQWVDGRSAKEVARAWLASDMRAPAEVEAALRLHSDFADLVVERVEPEVHLAFDQRRGPRNADLLVWARDRTGRVAVTVEAKADEEFDNRVTDVFDAGLERRIASPHSEGVARLIDLAESILPLRVPGTVTAGRVRYQLLTGVAGTLAHAAAVKADRAILLVHVFRSAKTSERKLAENTKDLDEFVARLSSSKVAGLSANSLVGPFHVPGKPLFSKRVALYIGKALRTIGTPSA